VAYLVAFVTLFALTELGRRVYRPYVYRNGIDDFGIADTMGNSLGTLTQIALGLCLVNATRIQGVRIVVFITLGYIVYEVLQPVLPRGTFDWHDVAATLAAGAVATLLLVLIHAFAPEQEKRVDESAAEHRPA
jgi:hypothetical protein